jgi:2-phosphoglycolate phosphatase
VSPIAAVFFDLDGTLIDSAPDLIAAMRRLRRELSQPPIVMDKVGAVVSKGGRAMLRAGFPGADEMHLESLLPRYLELYAEQIAVHTRTFDGIDHVLARFDARALPWGIVTNKPEHLARAVVAELGLAARSAALVGGDTLPVRKPDPAPLLHAAELAKVDATCSVYIGDDVRDIEAGRAAGMRTVAAAWGYLDGENPHAWGADFVVARPQDLLTALGFN